MKEMKLIMKFLIFSIITIFALSGIITTFPIASAENIPDWVKNTAGWWATDAISETDFVNAIEHLVNKDIIHIDTSSNSNPSENTPDWVKNTAGWWATDAISETDFVNAVEYLVNTGIINIQKQFSKAEIEEFFYQKETHISDEFKPSINSHGFRGAEIKKDKDNDTFRIIVAGDSTTFGKGVEDQFTWPSFLQQKLDLFNSNKKIQVINAGDAGGTSHKMSQLIKNKLIYFEPDLLILFMGVSDNPCMIPPFHNGNTDWNEEVILKTCGNNTIGEFPVFLSEIYSEICELGVKDDFETSFIFQPNLKLEGKILTSQELDSYFTVPQKRMLNEEYENIVKKTFEKTEGCNRITDLTKIFDNYDLPLFYDRIHVGNTGNEIIAEHILEVIEPILLEKNILTEKPNDFKNIELFEYESGQDLQNSDFSGENLENSDFFRADLRGSDFENAILSNVDFRLANLEDVNFKNAKIDNIKLRQNNLKNADFTNVNFTDVDLTNVDFTEAKLKNAILYNKDLSKTFFYNADLTGASITKSDILNVFFNDVNISEVDFTNTFLHEIDFRYIKDRDISGVDFTDAMIRYSDLQNMSFVKNKFHQTIFERSNLEKSDFSKINTISESVFAGTNLKNTNFSGVNFGEVTEQISKFPNRAHECGFEKCDEKNPGEISAMFFEDNFVRKYTSSNYYENKDDIVLAYEIWNLFIDVDASKSNFENSNLNHVVWINATLTNTNFKNTDLRYSIFSNVDFSNVDLTGAIIDDTTVFSDTELNCVNHEICN